MIKLNQSQIKDFKRCPAKWKYRYVDKIKKNVVKRPLFLGSLVHEGIEIFYSMGLGEGKRGAELWELIYQAVMGYKEEALKDETLFEEEMLEYEDMANDALDILSRYVDANQGDLEEYTLLGVEQNFEVPIKSPEGEPIAIFRGIFDLVVEDKHGNVWLMEHKTTKNSIENRLENIDTDEQIDLYLWALKNMFREEGLEVPVTGAIYNVLRSKIPTVPRTLKSGGLSKAKNIDTTYEVYLAEIHRLGLDPADYEDILTMLKEKGNTFFGREITTRSEEQLEMAGNHLYQDVRCMQAIPYYVRDRSFTCNWDCEYLEVCRVELLGQDPQPTIEGFYVPFENDDRYEDESDEDED